MADKPSRALVLYGDGLASLISASHSNLHSFASLSSCGFLSLRSPPSEDSVVDSRTARDFAQLLDSYDFYIAKNGQSNETDSSANLKQYTVPELSKRFMGLRAAIFSSSPSIISLASDLSLSTLQLEETDSSELPSQLLSLLGFSGQNVLETSEYDLVFLHITSETMKTQKGKNAIDWLDQLVGAMLTYTSVVLSYEKSSDTSCISLVKEMNSDLGLFRPRQSYTTKNGKPLDGIRHDHPMLVAQCQDGVTRRDLANAFTFEEFNKNGGNLAMLADRFLHENKEPSRPGTIGVKLRTVRLVHRHTSYHRKLNDQEKVLLHLEDTRYELDMLAEVVRAMIKQVEMWINDMNCGSNKPMEGYFSVKHICVENLYGD